MGNKVLAPDDPAHLKSTISNVPDRPLLESVYNELIDICSGTDIEQCGFIDSRWEVHPVENVHQFPARNFYMDPSHTLEVIHEIYRVAEERIIAVWHTHPNDVVWPSPRDIVGWPNPALGWRYFIATNKDVYEWQLSD